MKRSRHAEQGRADRHVEELREGSVRGDRAKMEENSRWIYNDIDEGFAEARATGLVLAATLCAFAGAFIGVRLLGKMTLAGVRRIVGTLLVLLGLAMALGLVLLTS